MERRNSIRAAIQGLLSPVPHNDDQPSAFGQRSAGAFAAAPSLACACTSGLSGQIFAEIQAELREHGIIAEVHEIAHAVLEALGSRPSLCRGLFADFLLEDG